MPKFYVYCWETCETCYEVEAENAEQAEANAFKEGNKRIYCNPVEFGDGDVTLVNEVKE